MGVDALVPVEEPFGVDHVADLQCFNSLIHLGVLTAQVGLHAEGVGLVVHGDVEVQVVALLAGAVPVVQEGSLVAVGVGAGSHGQAGEGNELVLMVDQLVGAKQVGNVQRLGNVGIALDKFKGAIRDLHFAGPFALVAGDTNLGAGTSLAASSSEQASSYRK